MLSSARAKIMLSLLTAVAENDTRDLTTFVTVFTSDKKKLKARTESVIFCSI
jgi:hypothetical protein